MRFRKKPVVVEAVQWTGKNHNEIKTFAQESTRTVDFYDDGSVLVIHTLEGDHVASVGDWIIRGVHGELYPCKPDIFAETYEQED